MIYNMFLNSPTIINKIQTKSSKYWQIQQDRFSINLAKKSYFLNKAYRRFLDTQKININKIITTNDFASLPKMSKRNYFNVYPSKEYINNNESIEPSIFTSTSGSTGIPHFFLRNHNIDMRCSIFMEYFLKNTHNMPKTLIVICFGMGVWIGGLITYNAFNLFSKRHNLPMSIITPGISKKEIINILKNIAQDYEQIVLAGYPPLIKDIIDEVDEDSLDLLRKKKIRIKFAAEAISEGFRDYIAEKTNMKNIYLDMVNIYGSAEIGAMAFEGTTSILIKRLARQNKKIFNTIFSKINKIPTLAQYYPSFVSFEESDGDILLSSDNIIPFIRYDIGDKGGVYTFDELNNRLLSCGIDLINEANKLGLQKYINKLPFVYIYERDDLSTSLYGICIYPEWFKDAMYHRAIQQHITGKFSIMTKYDIEHNQYIELNIELKKNRKQSKKIYNLVLKHVIISLRSYSSEYNELVNHIKERAYPKLKFWPYEHPLYFKPGIKQKWVNK